MAATDERVLLMVGRVIRSHGIRGELKVLPESDNPERLLDLPQVFIGEQESATTAFPVAAARFQQTKKGLAVLMTLEGISTRDDADALRKQVVYALQNDLPPLESGEYFLHEIIGSKVETDSGKEVGELKEIMELPAHDIYIVKRQGLPDVMIPAVPEFIEKVDVDEKLIVIRPIEGLLDT